MDLALSVGIWTSRPPHELVRGHWSDSSPMSTTMTRQTAPTSKGGHCRCHWLAGALRPGLSPSTERRSRSRSASTSVTRQTGRSVTLGGIPAVVSHPHGVDEQVEDRSTTWRRKLSRKSRNSKSIFSNPLKIFLNRRIRQLWYLENHFACKSRTKCRMGFYVSYDGMTWKTSQMTCKSPNPIYLYHKLSR